MKYVQPSNGSISCNVSEPCTFDQYANNSEQHFLSATTFIFQPGDHQLSNTVSLYGIQNVSFQGMLVDEGTVTIRLVSSHAGLSFDNCEDIEIKSLKFLLSDKFEFGLMFSDTRDVTLHDITISMDEESSTGCSAIISQESVIKVSDSRFVGISGQLGAALLAQNSSKIMFTGSNNFTSNSAKLGGAISSISSTLQFNDSVSFVENRATVSQSHNDESGCSYSPDFYDSGYGGAVYAENSQFIVRGCAQFLTNEATDEGGAIIAVDQSLLIIDGSSCLNNESGPMEVVFDSNSAASGSGGAINSRGSDVRIISTSFSNNYSPENGGAGHFLLSSVALHDITATNNRANGLNGGALSFFFCEAYLDGYNHFENNHSPQFGGAIDFFNTIALNIAGENHFEGNSAKLGGAFSLYAAVADTVVSGNITFKNNSAEVSGGAIYIYSSPMRASGNMEYIRFTRWCHFYDLFNIKLLWK